MVTIWNLARSRNRNNSLLVDERDCDPIERAASSSNYSIYAREAKHYGLLNTFFRSPGLSDEKCIAGRRPGGTKTSDTILIGSSSIRIFATTLDTAFSGLQE